MFSISITHHLKIKELSDGNNDPKLIQTNAHPWDPHDLDDGNKKLSDITQNSSHPNKLLESVFPYHFNLVFVKDPQLYNPGFSVHSLMIISLSSHVQNPYHYLMHIKKFLK